MFWLWTTSRSVQPLPRLVVVDNAAVLHTVRTRYKRSEIYTFAASSVMELWTQCLLQTYAFSAAACFSFEGLQDAGRCEPIQRAECLFKGAFSVSFTKRGWNAVTDEENLMRYLGASSTMDACLIKKAKKLKAAVAAGSFRARKRTVLHFWYWIYWTYLNIWHALNMLDATNRLIRKLICQGSATAYICIGTACSQGMWLRHTKNHGRIRTGPAAHAMAWYLFQGAAAEWRNKPGALPWVPNSQLFHTSQHMRRQVVLISGESGAGKTESAKLVMSYISEALDTTLTQNHDLCLLGSESGNEALHFLVLLNRSVFRLT